MGEVKPEMIPLLLCVAERDRPGRLDGLDDRLFDALQAELRVRFHPRSAVLPQGRVASALALAHARQLIYEERLPFCLLAGADSLLVAPTLAAYEQKERLLTSQNSNGFIPGEAGAAVLVSRPGVGTGESSELVCLGVGTGQENATIESEQPLRADGMVEAFTAAFRDAERTIADVDYRITDSNGEQYWFKEAALAVTRTLRVRKELFDIWHPADCIGETGAAAGLCALGVALAASRKQYAPGPNALCHFSSDGAQRVALVLAAPPWE
jgi:3-oxoacyl-[acyl-carrier-protein] synthase I